MSKVKLTILYFFILYNSTHGYSQNYAQVTHTLGTQNVDSIIVTVTSSSFVAYNYTYCINTFPYEIGKNLMDGVGSFTFKFFPAVSSISLNFAGLSNVTGHIEEIKLIKNGTHFP